MDQGRETWMVLIEHCYAPTVPQFGIQEAYTDPGDLKSALGIYLAAWFIVTFVSLSLLARDAILRILYITPLSHRSLSLVPFDHR